MSSTDDSAPNSPHISWSDSFSEGHKAIQSLSSILPVIPPSLSSSDNPSFSLLHDPQISSQISHLLRQPDSGSGDNFLCRWFYDTFQTSKADLQLVVLRFIPLLCGVYLSRFPLRKPLAGFEAVLLALYAHETTQRNGQAITLNIPNLSHSSIYHETKHSPDKSSTELNLAVVSSSLDPHGTVRSTRRARIVGVALELYYTKISLMPLDSKIDFCHFCVIWAGQDEDMFKDEDEAEAHVKVKDGRIPLPWELLQPVLRILGHCLMAPSGSTELREAASGACKSLHARALHDINPKAILATGSLLKLIKFDDTKDAIDYTDVTISNVINL